MAVPEAAMYKDDLAMPNEDDIWVSRKLWMMQAVAVALGMNDSAYNQLRLRVGLTYSPHTLGQAELTRH
jgi:hypothetical protein